MKLQDKVAIVTGGSSGIGKAGAILLAKEGADILLTFRSNLEGAIATQNEIKGIGNKCEIIKANLTNIKDIENVIMHAVNTFKGIDILINNAGDSNFIDFLEDSIENLTYLLDVNVKSIFLLSQMAAKEMIKRGGGSIVNVTSVSGISVNAPGLTSYCTSKAAANMLTKGMAKDLAKYNIRVNAILPGSIDTPLTRRKASEEIIKMTIEKTPLKKIGLPEDIANMIVFLSTSDSDFMTGSLVVMDGGLTL
ncbi:MAG: glucose 1-dehydrogenase [Actinobacteria bacterium]|nr:glucose 1-dehydrogenase [Actinomycetota bacterium]